MQEITIRKGKKINLEVQAEGAVILRSLPF